MGTQEITLNHEACFELQDHPDEFIPCYDLFMQLIPVGIFQTSRMGEIIYANKKYMEITGLTLSELRQAKWVDYIHPQDRKKVIKEWENSEENVNVFDLDYRYCHPKKKTVWLSVVSTTFKNSKGVVLGSVGIVEDVTKQYQEQQAQSCRKAQINKMNRLHSVWNMRSSLSHEMNQPLSIISIYAQECIRLISLKLLNKEQLKTALTKINRHALRASSILNQGRDLSKENCLSKARVNMDGFFHSIFQIINQDLQYNVEFETNLSDKQCVLHIDKLKIEQVILNVVQNSIESIQGSNKSHMVIQITTETKNDCFFIHMIDSGPGMKDDIQAQCFDPFFTTKKEGAGLGLAICASIVEAHNGRIYVNKDNPVGTKISIELPID